MKGLTLLVGLLAILLQGALWTLASVTVCLLLGFGIIWALVITAALSVLLLAVTVLIDDFPQEDD